MVCLEFITVEALQHAQRDTSKKMKRLFYKVLPWKDVVTKSGRCIWLQSSKIPMQTWGKETFERIANALGTYITADHNTMTRKRMDVARILIATEQDDVNRTIIGEFNGTKYTISYKENPCKVYSLVGIGFLAARKMKRTTLTKTTDQESDGDRTIDASINIIVEYQSEEESDNNPETHNVTVSLPEEETRTSNTAYATENGDERSHAKDKRTPTRNEKETTIDSTLELEQLEEG